uniref:Uncharacterized protein n=1 Tax=Auxenochlorella protothecoides TaxID=3075 RepID=A0A1D2AA94_AUXPR
MFSEAVIPVCDPECPLHWSSRPPLPCSPSPTSPPLPLPVSAGRIRRPSGRIVEDYHMCCAVRSGEDRHVKSILNTEFAQHFQSVHHANYTGGRVTTNTCGEAIPRYTAAAPCLERLALRHYVTKSLWDFTQKLARGSGMSRRKDWTYFYRVQKMAWQDCRLPAAWPLGRGPVDEGGLGAVTAS